jgi:hypothetical protein
LSEKEKANEGAERTFKKLEIEPSFKEDNPTEVIAQELSSCSEAVCSKKN